MTIAMPALNGTLSNRLFGRLSTARPQEAASFRPARDRVREAMAHGATNVYEIADRTGLNPSTVRACRRRLRVQG